MQILAGYDGRFSVQSVDQNCFFWGRDYSNKGHNPDKSILCSSFGEDGSSVH
jgi:hypothetical protein